MALNYILFINEKINEFYGYNNKTNFIAIILSNIGIKKLLQYLPMSIRI